MFRQAPCTAMAITAIFLLGIGQGAAASSTTLTIEVGDTLFKHGGVVTVYPIPVSPEEWMGDAGDAAPRVRIGSRYAEVQLKYPKGETMSSGSGAPLGHLMRTSLARMPFRSSEPMRKIVAHR